MQLISGTLQKVGIPEIYTLRPISWIGYLLFLYLAFKTIDLFNDKRLASTAIIFIFYINSTTAEEIYENTFLLYPIPIILVLFFNLLNKQLVNKEIRDDPTMHILLDKKIFALFLLISFFYFFV